MAASDTKTGSGWRHGGRLKAAQEPEISLPHCRENLMPGRTGDVFGAASGPLRSCDVALGRARGMRVAWRSSDWRRVLAGLCVGSWRVSATRQRKTPLARRGCLLVSMSARPLERDSAGGSQRTAKLEPCEASLLTGRAGLNYSEIGDNSPEHLGDFSIFDGRVIAAVPAPLSHA